MLAVAAENSITSKHFVGDDQNGNLAIIPATGGKVLLGGADVLSELKAHEEELTQQHGMIQEVKIQLATDREKEENNTCAADRAEVLALRRELDLLKSCSHNRQNFIFTAENGYAVTAIAMDDSQIVSGLGGMGAATKLRFQDRKNNHETLKVFDTAHIRDIISLAMDASIVVSGSSDGIAIVWDRSLMHKSSEAIQIKTITVAPGYSGAVYSIALDADIVVTAYSDGTVNIWNRKDNYNNMKRLDGANGHSSDVLSVALDANVVISGSIDGTVKVWDRGDDYRLIETLRAREGFSVKSVALDDSVVVGGLDDNSIMIWSRDGNYNLVKTLGGHTATKYAPSTNIVALRPKVIVSQDDQFIRVFDRRNNSYNLLNAMQGDLRGSTMVMDDTVIVSTMASGGVITLWKRHCYGV